MHDTHVRDFETPMPGDEEHAAAEVTPPRAMVFAAFCGLTFVDVAVRTVGFAHIRRRLAKYALRQADVTPEDLGRALAAVNHAALYYPRELKCFPRSAALTWLLRRRGIPAQLIIGCRHTPFYGHAWVQLGDNVINDKPIVKTLYPELERV